MPDPLPPFFWPPGTGTEPSAPPPPDRQVLGHDGAAYFVVLGDGAVASVNPVVALSTRFVNSSAHQFLSCLDALATRLAQLTQAKEDEVVLAVSELRHDVNRFDIAALSDRDDWWPVVLDRLEEALP